MTLKHLWGQDLAIFWFSDLPSLEYDADPPNYLRVILKQTDNTTLTARRPRCPRTISPNART